MTLRKPLVLNSGEVEELSASDTLEASVAEKDVITLENDNASTINLGEVVYVKSNGKADLARANAVGTSFAIGLVADATIAAGATGQIQTDGVLSGLSGLTAGSKYWLSSGTAGAMVSTPPSGAGNFLTPVGRAISTTALEITIGQTIKLN